MIKNILFDLDGTLLNMDQDKFLKLYTLSLYNTLKDEYKDIHELSYVIETGVKLMFNNNGSKTNEKVFYEHFKNYHKDKTDYLLKRIEKYYDNEFIYAKEATSSSIYAPLLIKELNQNNFEY